MGYEIWPYTMHIGQKKPFLLHLSYEEDNRDVFLKTDDGHLAFFFDKGEVDPDMRERINEPDTMYALCPQDFLKTLRHLDADQPSHISECDILLNWWNFLEDVLRTYDDFELFPALKQDVLNGVYRKLFAGNNLPSMMPDGYTQENPYHPFWTDEEVLIVTQEMTRLYQYFTTKCPNALVDDLTQDII